LHELATASRLETSRALLLLLLPLLLLSSQLPMLLPQQDLACQELSTQE
jgi:hypothetical protein